MGRGSGLKRFLLTLKSVVVLLYCPVAAVITELLYTPENAIFADLQLYISSKRDLRRKSRRAYDEVSKS